MLPTLEGSCRKTQPRSKVEVSSYSFDNRTCVWLLKQTSSVREHPWYLALRGSWVQSILECFIFWVLELAECLEFRVSLEVIRRSCTCWCNLTWEKSFLWVPCVETWRSPSARWALYQVHPSSVENHQRDLQQWFRCTFYRGGSKCTYFQEECCQFPTSGTEAAQWIAKSAVYSSTWQTFLQVPFCFCLGYSASSRRKQ